MRRVAIKVESVVEFTSRKNTVIVGRLSNEVLRRLHSPGILTNFGSWNAGDQKNVFFTFPILINSSPAFSRSKFCSFYSKIDHFWVQKIFESIQQVRTLINFSFTWNYWASYTQYYENEVSSKLRRIQWERTLIPKTMRNKKWIPHLPQTKGKWKGWEMKILKLHN